MLEDPDHNKAGEPRVVNNMVLVLFNFELKLPNSNSLNKTIEWMNNIPDALMSKLINGFTGVAIRN